MKATISVDSLARRVLGEELYESINRAKIQAVKLPPDDPHISVDDFGRKHLPEEVDRALSKIDHKAGQIGVGLQIKELRIYGQGGGFSLLLVILILAHLLTGIDDLIVLARALLEP